MGKFLLSVFYGALDALLLMVVYSPLYPFDFTHSNWQYVFSYYVKCIDIGHP